MDAPEPSDWSCPVCAAAHAQPALRCRRCGTDLLPFVRMAVAARRLRDAGRDDEADCLVGDGG